jgi:hypothetical protein
MTRFARHALVYAALAVMTAMGGCARSSQQRETVTPSIEKLVFLTRQGCVNTATMRANLDEALKTLGLPRDYQFIDADSLAPQDPRGGYGTPTVLYDARDIFDMPEPPAPHPPAT